MANWKSLDLEGDSDDNFELELNLNDSDGDNEKLDTQPDETGSEEVEEEEVETEASDEQEKEQEEQPKKEVKGRSRAKRRIERLARENKTLQEENKRLQELQERLAKLEQTSSASKIDSTLSSLNDKIEAKQREYQEALENDEHAKASKINLEIGDLLIDRKVAAAQKQEAVKEPAKEEQQKSSQQTQQNPEAYEDWVEENPWFAEPETRDERRLARYIKKKGKELAGDDPEYVLEDEFYEELSDLAKAYVVEKKLKVDGFELPEEKPAKKKTSPTDSGGRDSGVTKVGKRIRVTLSEDEKRVAKRMGMTYEEYAKSKIQNEKRTKTGWTSVFE